MKLAVIGAGKWGLVITKRYLNKVQIATLPLGWFTMRHLVPYLHCDLVACQQPAHTTSCILFKVLEKGYKI
ncbi:MAG: hypothetical protein PHU67_02105 [Sulfurovum sp.]|jgi:hypothetical protein|nr:hypothetical protein [Sulfurovum sp.]MDD3499177.1 hypothetical protein [Sulfurovum sp.]